LIFQASALVKIGVADADWIATDYKMLIKTVVSKINAHFEFFCVGAPFFKDFHIKIL
jgi:hypothetical protein